MPKSPCALRQLTYSVFKTLIWRDTRPKKMLRGTRSIVNDFVNDERLFFRWYVDWVEHDGKVSRANVPTPDQSVNRSKHGGKSWFVLIPDVCERGDSDYSEKMRRLCQGAYTFLVREIPEPTTENGHSYAFRVEHDPEENNYQHCEIRIFRDGYRVKEMPPRSRKYATVDLSGTILEKVSKTEVDKVKLYYRHKIAEAATKAIKAMIGTKEHEKKKSG